MDLRLTYRGDLPPQRPSDRQRVSEIRHRFHLQLKECWQLPPLKHHANLLKLKPAMVETSVIETRNETVFAPLVTDKLFLTTRLNILLLRPGAPGNLYDAGVIDSRIQMLLDALRMPTEDEMNGGGLNAGTAEEPFFCLLQSDAVISDLSVTTGCFLDATEKDECLSIVSCELRPTKTSWDNIGLV